MRSPVRSTLGPRGRGRALGDASSDEQVAKLQAQVNRFIVSPGRPLPITGRLDQATAIAAQSIIIQRFGQAFANDPRNAVTTRLFVEANRHLGDALPWVRSRLNEITDTLRDYGDFIGRPPAKGQGASSAKVLALVIAGAAALVYLSGRRSRRRR